MRKLRWHVLFEDLQRAPAPRSLQAKLARAPKGLTDLYAMITNRFSETLDEDRLSLCRKALQRVITAKQDLTVTQLAVALAIRDGRKSLDESDMMFDPREEILTVCAPLFKVLDDDVVRIVYLSVRDFLLDSSRKDGQDNFVFSKDSLNANIGISLLTLLF
jgi:hypothetical protein